MMLKNVIGLVCSIFVICCSIAVVLYGIHGRRALDGPEIGFQGNYSTYYSISFVESVRYTRNADATDCQIRLDKYMRLGIASYVDADCDDVTDFIKTIENIELQGGDNLTRDVQIVRGAVEYEKVFEKMDKLFVKLGTEYLEVIKQLPKT